MEESSMALECSRCQTPRDSMNVFCTGCGQEFPQSTGAESDDPASRCAQCHKAFVSKDAAFCIHCGHPKEKPVPSFARPAASTSISVAQPRTVPPPPSQASGNPLPASRQPVVPQFQVLHCSQCQAVLIPGSISCIKCELKFTQPVPKVRLPSAVSASAPSTMPTSYIEEQPKSERQYTHDSAYSSVEPATQYQPATQLNSVQYANQLPSFATQPPSDGPLPMDIKFLLTVAIACVVSFIACYQATSHLPHYSSQIQDGENAIGGAVSLPFAFMMYLGLRKLASLLVLRTRSKHAMETRNMDSSPGHSTLSNPKRRLFGLENFGLAAIGGLIIWVAVAGVIPSILAGPRMELSRSMNSASALIPVANSVSESVAPSQPSTDAPSYAAPATPTIERKPVQKFSWGTGQSAAAEMYTTKEQRPQELQANRQARDELMETIQRQQSGIIAEGNSVAAANGDLDQLQEYQNELAELDERIKHEEDVLNLPG